jgi:apolipoprotein N-acyltransferase
MDALPKLLPRLDTRILALLAFLAGALSVLAMAPFFLWPIMFATFPLLIWALDAICVREDGGEAMLPRVRGRLRPGGRAAPPVPAAATPFALFRDRLFRAAFIGWAFGFGYFLASIYWIGYAFYVDAERYAMLMPFAVAALPAVLALFYAAAAALTAAMWRKGYARLAAFAFAFFLAEAARGYLFTGFPWNLFGEALAANAPHMQLAAYIGVYGLTLAALFIFPAPAALAAVPEARGNRLFAPIILAAIALIGSYAFGVNRLRETAGEVAGVRIRIVQPNIPQGEKWNPQNRQWIFGRILSLSRNGTSGEDIGAFTHVIWPESSVPFLFGFNRGIFMPDARNILAALIPAHTSLILGAERAEGILEVDSTYTFNRVYNSLFVLGEGAGIASIYDKVHLVPFGEYMPFGEVLAAAGLHALSHRLSDFASGSQASPPIRTPQAPDFIPLICYEAIFPGRVADLNARPGWMVNVTNDAWFGDSTGPHQHLHQARIRATEEGLPIMRAANTGISAAIDPYGRVLTKIDLGETGTIDTGLPRALPVTFYEMTRLPAFVFFIIFPLQFYILLLIFRRSR